MLYNMEKVNVIKTNVLIEITERLEAKVGSIYIPPAAQGKKGKVWQGVVHKTGTECEEDLKIGEKVLFDISQSTNFDNIFAICPEEFIIAKLKD